MDPMPCLAEDGATKARNVQSLFPCPLQESLCPTRSWMELGDTVGLVGLGHIPVQAVGSKLSILYWETLRIRIVLPGLEMWTPTCGPL